MKILTYLRGNTFLADMTAVVGSDFTAALFNVVASVVIARLLGPEKRGIVATILAVPFMVFPLAEMGIRQTAAYYIGKRVADDCAVFATLGLLSIALSVLGVALTLLIGAANGLPARHGWGGVLLASAFIPFNLYFSAAKGVLIGKRLLTGIAVSTVAIPISYLVMLLPLGFVDQHQVEGAVLATVLSTLVGAIFIGFRFREIGTLRPKHVSGLPTQILRLGVAYALVSFVTLLNYRLDVLILERLSSVEQVGLYAVAVRLAETLWMVPNALSLVNFSYSASAQDQLAQSRRTARMMRLVLLAALVPGAVLMLGAQPIISFVYGSDYLGSAAAVQAILPGIWFALLFKMLNSDLAGRGLPWIALRVNSLGVLVNVLLCLAWIPGHDAVGASWASTVSYFVIAAVTVVVYSRVTGVRLSQLVIPRRSDINSIYATLAGPRPQGT